MDIFGSYSKREERNRILFCFLSFLVILALLHVIGWIEEIKTPYLHTREYCIQHFASGTLYGDHPYCAQGPITYAMAYILKFIPFNYELSLKLFYLFSIFTTLYFMCRIIDRETNEKYPLFFMFIVIFLFVKYQDLAVIVATFFLVLGFYFLYYTKRGLLGSIILALSLFAKAHTFLVIGLIFFFYLLRIYHDKKPKCLREFVDTFRKPIFMLVLPAVGLFFIFNIIYSHFPTYYLLAQTAQTYTDYGTLLKAFFSLEYTHIGLFLITYTALFLFFIRLLERKIDVFSVISGISFPTFFLKSLTGQEIIYGSTYFYYFLIFLPFYCVLLYKIKSEFRGYCLSVKVLFFLGCFLLLLPIVQVLIGLSLSDITDKSAFNDEALIHKIQKEFSYPFFSLNTTGMILVTTDYSEGFGDENNFLYIAPDRFLNINPDSYDTEAHLRPDGLYARQLVSLEIVDSLDPYTFNKSKAFSDLPIVENFQETYSVLVQYPNSDSVYIEQYLSLHNLSLEQIPCGIFTPYITGTYIPRQNNYLLLYFTDVEECKIYTLNMFSYYYEKFDALCHRSPDMTKSIEKTFFENKIEYDMDCRSFSKLAVFTAPQQIQEIYFIFFVLLFLIIQAFNSFLVSKS